MTRVPSFASERERLEWWAVNAPKGQRIAAQKRVQRLTTADLALEVATKRVAKLAAAMPAQENAA